MSVACHKMTHYEIHCCAHQTKKNIMLEKSHIKHVYYQYDEAQIIGATKSIMLKFLIDEHIMKCVIY